MRFLIAAAGLLLTASVGLAGEVTTDTTAPVVSTVVATGQSGLEGDAALTPAPTQAKSKSYGGYEGCHQSRQAQAPLLMY